MLVKRGGFGFTGATQRVRKRGTSLDARKLSVCLESRQEGAVPAWSVHLPPAGLTATEAGFRNPAPDPFDGCCVLRSDCLVHKLYTLQEIEDLVQT